MQLLQKISWYSVVSGDDLLEFHQAVVSTLRETDDMPIPLDPAPMAPMNSMNMNMNMNMNNMMMDLHHSEHQPHPDEVARLKRETQITDLNQVDHNEDESDNGSYKNYLNILIFVLCISVLQYLRSTFQCVSINHQNIRNS